MRLLWFGKKTLKSLKTMKDKICDHKLFPHIAAFANNAVIRIEHFSVFESPTKEKKTHKELYGSH